VKEKQIFYEIIRKRKRKQAPSFFELSRKVQLRKNRKILCKLRVQQKWSSSNGEQKKVELIILFEKWKEERIEKFYGTSNILPTYLLRSIEKKQGK
jgi:hypothetical protein